jgi:hypothetical protein
MLLAPTYFRYEIHKMPSIYLSVRQLTYMHEFCQPGKGYIATAKPIAVLMMMHLSGVRPPWRGLLGNTETSGLA